jgi:hypothetical protein
MTAKLTKLIQRKWSSEDQWILLFLTLGTKAHEGAATHKYYGLPRVEIRTMSLQANDKSSSGTDFVLKHHQDHVQGSTRIALRGTRLPDSNQIQTYTQMKNSKYH